MLSMLVPKVQPVTALNSAASAAQITLCLKGPLRYPRHMENIRGTHLCTNDVIKVTTRLLINTSIYRIPVCDAAINFKMYISNILHLFYIKHAIRS